MNEKRSYYYPAMAYTLLLVIIWLFSWITGMLVMVTGAECAIAPLVTAEGVRWAVRSALPALNELPWGTVMTVIVMIGLVRGSGLKKALMHLFGPKPVTQNQKRSLLSAFTALILFGGLLFVATMSPWNLLLGVTGGIDGSPLVHGWVVILFFCVLTVSVAYGFIYGNYRSAMDVPFSLGETFILSVPGLIALVPAAGIVPCLDYVGVFAFFDMPAEEVAVFSDIVYAIPFLYMILLHLMEKKSV